MRPPGPPAPRPGRHRHPPVLPVHSSPEQGSASPSSCLQGSPESFLRCRNALLPTPNQLCRGLFSGHSDTCPFCDPRVHGAPPPHACVPADPPSKTPASFHPCSLLPLREERRAGGAACVPGLSLRLHVAEGARPGSTLLPPGVSSSPRTPPPRPSPHASLLGHLHLGQSGEDEGPASVPPGAPGTLPASSHPTHPPTAPCTHGFAKRSVLACRWLGSFGGLGAVGLGRPCPPRHGEARCALSPVGGPTLWPDWVGAAGGRNLGGRSVSPPGLFWGGGHA